MSEIRVMHEPLSQLIERFGDYAEHAKTTQEQARALIAQICEQAQAEQVSNAELRAMLADTLVRRGLAQATIYRYLPDSVKDPIKRMNRLGKKSQQRDIDQMTQASNTQTHATLPPRLFASLYTYMRAKKELKLLIANGEVRRIEVPEI